MTMPPPGYPPHDHPHGPSGPTSQLPAQGFGPQGPPRGPGGPGPGGPGGFGGPGGGPFGPQFGGPGQQPGGPGGPGPQRSSAATGVWILGLVATLAVVIGLSVEEDGHNAWHTVHAWGALAIVGALLTLAPVALAQLSRQRAWQISACGAGALVLFWVLFVLPNAGSNTSLATTVGVACGVIATWIAPGREAISAQQRPHSW